MTTESNDACIQQYFSNILEIDIPKGFSEKNPKMKNNGNFKP